VFSCFIVVFVFRVRFLGFRVSKFGVQGSCFGFPSSFLGVRVLCFVLRTCVSCRVSRVSRLAFQTSVHTLANQHDDGGDRNLSLLLFFITLDPRVE